MEDKKPNFVLDIDGVMTTGQFLYSQEGKAYKIFGPHDSDGLKLIKEKVNIVFITADKRGFPISKKRIEDMGYPIELVTEQDRYTYIKEKYGFENTFFMGDGIFDARSIKECKFGIAPKNARKEAKESADFITPSVSANGAVCDACLEINKRFFSEDNSDYKVCILAAGIGSRMESFSKTFNKVLLPVQGKPVICHIIEKFPEDIEIVIAVGYKKETIIDYLQTAFPQRKLTFVEVDKYEGEGTGPGYSILQCKPHLQCPFIHFAGDTLVTETVPPPDKNWLGLALISNSERFCSAKLENSQIIQLDDKTKNENRHAYIGLVGIKDYLAFWEKLEGNQNLIAGELQISNGLNGLIEKGLTPQIFTWFDTGTPDSYQHALNNFPHGNSYQGE